MMPKKNDIICFSQGSYSDYSLMGHFVVLKDFSMKKVGTAYLASDLGMQDVFEYFDRSTRPWTRLPEPIKTGEKPVDKTSDGFQGYLLRQGLVNNLDVTEYYLGDYTFEVPSNE